MSRLSTVFRASLEDQEISTPTTPVVSDPVIDQAVELAEQQAKFDKANDDFETLSNVAQTLESVATVMDECRDTGLTPQAAYYANLVVDGQSKRVGLQQPATPAQEAYVGFRARMSTTVALEGIRERLNEVREKLTRAQSRVDTLKSTI